MEFLTEEIITERKAQATKNIPTELEGFKVSLNGSEMSLTKKCDTESYVVLKIIKQNVFLTLKKITKNIKFIALKYNLLSITPSTLTPKAKSIQMLKNPILGN